MKHISLAVFSISVLSASVAFAQSPPAPSSNMKLSDSECTSLWQKANADKASGLTEAQSQPYVTDFKAANPDGDMTIDQNEWMAACNKGLVKSASNGASTGAGGKTSDRTPGDAAPARTPGATDTGAAGTDAAKTSGGTSDRTPNK